MTIHFYSSEATLKQNNQNNNTDRARGLSVNLMRSLPPICSWQFLLELLLADRNKQNNILDGNKIKTLDHVIVYSVMQRLKLWTTQASSTVK